MFYLFERPKNAKSPGNYILGLFRLRSQNKKTTSYRFSTFISYGLMPKLSIITQRGSTISILYSPWMPQRYNHYSISATIIERWNYKFGSIIYDFFQYIYQYSIFQPLIYRSRLQYFRNIF